MKCLPSVYEMTLHSNVLSLMEKIFPVNFLRTTVLNKEEDTSICKVNIDLKRKAKKIVIKRDNLVYTCQSCLWLLSIVDECISSIDII